MCVFFEFSLCSVSECNERSVLCQAQPVWLRPVLCVVLVAADFPQVRLPGLLAACRVLLLFERGLVIGQRAQVLRAGFDRCLDVEETGAG